LQPLPLPSPPTLVKQETPQLPTTRRSSNDAVPASKTRLPVVFAKAEAIEPQAVSETKITAPFAVHAETSAPTQHPVAVAMLEDTREHAIDPNDVPPLNKGSHPAAAKPAADAPNKRAAVEASEDSAKQQDRLAAPADAPAVPLSQVVSLASSTVAQPAAVVAMVPEAERTEEPKAGPILTVSASALTPPAVEPVSLSLAIMGLNDHPPLPPEKPSVMAAKLVAGAAAAAVEAAEPRSPEPLRILITRRTNRDGLREAQYMLAAMGYLEPQNFDGTFGTLTARAIKAFQEANDLPQTGAFTDEVEKKIYAAAGKEEPPQGHLFVRQKFASVLDVPVSFRNPDEPLGTHVFTVMHIEQGATKAQWMGINLNDGEDSTAVLDRIEIPDELRRNLSERLTPGSSMIVADTAINSATLPKGADFLVWDSSKPAKVERASVSPAPVKKRRATTRRRVTPTYTRRVQRRNPWPF
jgi:peptidoglycan hydrolase-like protein with peptidoglycan-binding domain